jgi:hypothetical protein
VERLLDSITKKPTELPTDLAELFELAPNEAFVPPDSWVKKSTHRKVFELCIVDKLTQSKAAIIIGCDQATVSRNMHDILVMIDNL